MKKTRRSCEKQGSSYFFLFFSWRRGKGVRVKPNPAQTCQAGGSQGITCSSHAQALHWRQSPQSQTRKADNTTIRMPTFVSHPTALNEVTPVLRWVWENPVQHWCTLSNWAAVIIPCHSTVLMKESLGHQCMCMEGKVAFSFRVQRSRLIHQVLTAPGLLFLHNEM